MSLHHLSPVGGLPLSLVEAGHDVIGNGVSSVREGEVNIAVAYAAVIQDVFKGEIEEEKGVEYGGGI